MKKHFAVLVVILFSVACAKDNRHVERTDIVLTKSQIEYVHSGNELGFTLFKTMDDVDTKDNLLSPFSVQLALSMLVAGAADNTAEEIVATLGYGNTVDETISYLADMSGQFELMDRKTDVAFSNALLLNKGSFVSVLPSYSQALSKHHDCQVFPFDFDTQALYACERVNAWTSDNTAGLIPEVICPSDLLPSYVLLLLNSAYFKSEWCNPFDIEQTSEDPFFPSEGISFLTPMMHMKWLFDYYDNEILSALTMDYGNGAFRFTVLLPREGHSLSSMVESLHQRSFQEILDLSKETNVSVGIPRFEFDSEINLEKQLDRVGIHEAFTNKADFSNMVDKKGQGAVYVSAIKQKTHIKVDESGAAAASQTRIGVGYFTAAPSGDVNEIKEFTANRPFLFIISERSSGIILFMGSYTGER